jgi:Spy/CpxP family protein refolding chaperone
MAGHHYSWSNPRVLLTFALIFLCGALVGAIAITLTADPATLSMATTPQEINRNLTLSNLSSELQLTTAQQERLRAVLDDYFQYYHALQDQLDEVKASGQEKILEILDDEQKAKFRKMVSDAQTEQGAAQ